MNNSLSISWTNWKWKNTLLKILLRFFWGGKYEDCLKWRKWKKFHFFLLYCVLLKCYLFSIFPRVFFYPFTWNLVSYKKLQEIVLIQSIYLSLSPPICLRERVEVRPDKAGDSGSKRPARYHSQCKKRNRVSFRIKRKWLSNAKGDTFAKRTTEKGRNNDMLTDRI